MIMEEKISNDKNVYENTLQNIIVENRKKLSLSGVKDVLSFDDQVVIVETELGLLTIKGDNLKINKLSLDSSEVVVEGTINNLGYSENHTKVEGSIFGKIFK